MCCCENVTFLIFGIESVHGLACVCYTTMEFDLAMAALIFIGGYFYVFKNCTYPCYLWGIDLIMGYSFCFSFIFNQTRWWRSGVYIYGYLQMTHIQRETFLLIRSRSVLRYLRSMSSLPLLTTVVGTRFKHVCHVSRELYLFALQRFYIKSKDLIWFTVCSSMGKIMYDYIQSAVVLDCLWPLALF